MTDKITLKRNEKTGLVEAFVGEDKIGKVISMGDQVKKEEKDEDLV